jgi:glutamate dehydrogenase/leucine dehydrogenase
MARHTVTRSPEAIGRPLRPSKVTIAGRSLHDDDHERVVVRQDPATGLRMVVAVHSTALGPAIGGMRWKRYPGGIREAQDDALALARTMTLKASAAGLDTGGGKAVVIDDGRDELREQRLLAAADVVDSLGGDYVTAEDIGTSTADMDLIATRTRYVVGRSPENGGGGDPSPVTAQTVLEALRRGLAHATGSPELDGRTVGVVGLGKVGSPLAASLARAGARVIACDLDAARAERFADEHGAEIVPSAEAILTHELDVLAPCAAGGMIDDAIARSLRTRVVAGAANNPLTDRRVAELLRDRGIVYVPDFLANCGGLIHVADEWTGANDERAAIAHAMERLDDCLVTAEATGRTPLDVAEHQALERVEAARAATL